MWNADDVRVTRWHRLRTAVDAMPFDTLLRWALLANVVLVSVLSGVAVLAMLWSAGVAIVTALIGLVF